MSFPKDAASLATSCAEDAVRDWPLLLDHMPVSDRDNSRYHSHLVDDTVDESCSRKKRSPVEATSPILTDADQPL